MSVADSSLLLQWVFCFCLGSIPFAVLAMMGTGIDIRRVGSGNPGFNNVLRVSKGRAVFALIGDMGKGFLAVWLVLHLGHPGNPLAVGWLCGSAVVLGHCYSPFLKFNGGKGIAASAGVMLLLYPLWAFIALAYFMAVRIIAGRLKWREAGAIASLTTLVLLTLLLLGFVGRQDAAYASMMTLFLAWRHKNNLKNLACGHLTVESPGTVAPMDPGRRFTPNTR